MIDVFNIPSSNQSTFTFYSTGNWQTWNKPRGAKMLEIFCLGAGGGGSHTTAIAGNVVGGGGGASGGIVKGLIPAFLLPDTLYILVGRGGVGPSTSNTAGGSGGISYIGTQPSILDRTLVCKSSSTVAGGGTAAGGAATAPTIAGVTTFPLANLGLFTAIAGVAGVAGGANTGAAGNSQNALGTNLVTGGAGGGGKTASVFGIGGRINGASVVLTSTVLGGITAGQNGNDGYGTLQPFCGTGGGGGASVTTGTGGRGGDGWYGCGGGGAGGGTVATKAGDGGNGLVIITVIS